MSFENLSKLQALCYRNSNINTTVDPDDDCKGRQKLLKLIDLANVQLFCWFRHHGRIEKAMMFPSGKLSSRALCHLRRQPSFRNG
jgi:hypothetical protein